jgi:hypothetical protein
MIKLYIPLIVIILTSLLLPSISAKSSDVFIDYLTDMMWKNCQGNDIHINQPVLTYTATNQSVSLIKWPYDRSTIREIVRIFGEEQQIFTTIFGGTCENYANSTRIGGINGCGILTSGNNRLDINGYNYFWNGIKVDVPLEILNLKTTYGPNSSIIETHGEKSPVTTGPNSPINQQEDAIWVQLFLPKVTLAGMIIGAIITALFDLVIKLRRTKK